MSPLIPSPVGERGIKGRLLSHPPFLNLSPSSPVLLGCGGGDLLFCPVADFCGTPVLGHPLPSWGPGALSLASLLSSSALSTLDSALKKSQC